MKIVVPSEISVTLCLSYDIGTGLVHDNSKNVRYLLEHSIWADVKEGVHLVAAGIKSGNWDSRSSNYVASVVFKPKEMSIPNARKIVSKMLGGFSSPKLLITGDIRCPIRGAISPGNGMSSTLPGPVEFVDALSDPRESEESSFFYSTKEEVAAVVGFWRAFRDSTQNSGTAGTITKNDAVREISTTINTLISYTISPEEVNLTLDEKKGSGDQGKNWKESIIIPLLSDSRYHRCSFSPVRQLPKFSDGKDPETNLKFSGVPEIRGASLQALKVLDTWPYDVMWYKMKALVHEEATRLNWKSRSREANETKARIRRLRPLTLREYVEVSKPIVLRAKVHISRIVPKYDNSQEIEDLLENAGYCVKGLIDFSSMDNMMSAFRSDPLTAVESILSYSSGGRIRKQLYERMLHHKALVFERASFRFMQDFEGTQKPARRINALSGLGEDKLTRILEENPGFSKEVAKFLVTQVEVEGSKDAALLLASNEWLVNIGAD